VPPPEPNIAIRPLFASVALPSIVVVVAAVPVVSVGAPFGSSVEVVVYEPLPGIDAAVVLLLLLLLMSLLQLPPTVVVHIVVDVPFLDPMGSVVAVNLVLVLVAGTFDFDLSLPLYHSLLLRPLSPSLSPSLVWFIVASAPLFLPVYDGLLLPR
jgi:hypothetical protein